MIFFFEIENEQHVGDEDGDETGERRAGHADTRKRNEGRHNPANHVERRPCMSGSENEKWREHDVERDTEHLQDDSRLDDTGCAQGRPERHQRKLQQQRGKEPKHVRFRQPGRVGIGAERVAIPVHEHESAETERDRHEDRHDERLIEDELAAWLIFLSGGVRNERGRSHAKHLRQRQHNHGQISGHAHAGDRFLTETADPIKIGQQIKRLHHHAHGHERRHV